VRIYALTFIYFHESVQVDVEIVMEERQNQHTYIISIKEFYGHNNANSKDWRI
jgi:hypothetical protein